MSGSSSPVPGSPVIVLVSRDHSESLRDAFWRYSMPKTMESMQNIETVAEKYGVKVHGLYNALPDHVEFLIGEADSPAALAMYISEAIPYGEADTETHAVVGVDELRAAAQAMSGT